MNILVPTDFSAISLNAAQFATRMLAGQHEAKLILYHVYAKATDGEAASEKLEALKEQLAQGGALNVDCAAEESSDFIDSLERKIKHYGVGLVVMTINDKTKFEQVVSSSNSLRLIDKNVCPVLVIPHDAKFNDIKNVALACDFVDVENAIPIVPVTNVLALFKPAVHIVNINSEIYISLTEEYLEQRRRMIEMFAEFTPEFYFITTYDFHETLRQFIDDKNIDLVITFPRKHGYINNLIKGNNTKKLVIESAIPVLAAHG